MTEKFIIDEEYVKQRMEKAVNITRAILDKITTAIDEEEDIFIRYFSFNFVESICSSIRFMKNVQEDILRTGHNLSHPFLQTDRAEEYGWKKADLDDFFFCQKEESNQEDDSLRTKIDSFFQEIEKMMKDK